MIKIIIMLNFYYRKLNFKKTTFLQIYNSNILFKYDIEVGFVPIVGKRVCITYKTKKQKTI